MISRVPTDLTCVLALASLLALASRSEFTGQREATPASERHPGSSEVSSVFLVVEPSKIIFLI